MLRCVVPIVPQLTLFQAPPDRKSIGAEVNYGVRFDTQDQANGFVSELAGELSRRMAAEGVVGRALTLKIMKQRDVSFCSRGSVDPWCPLQLSYTTAPTFLQAAAEASHGAAAGRNCRI